jgi:ribosomal protein L11 methyltransferase
MSGPPGAPGAGAPDRWLVLRVRCPADPDRAALAVEELLALPARGVEERDGRLVVYLPPPGDGDPAPVVERVARRLGPILGEPPRVEARWQPHEAWEERWRRGLAPRRVTSRLVVSPSWCDPRLAPGEIGIIVDPGMAFGTAEHPTTRGSLQLLDRLVEPGHRAADVGAGSGILSIAAARLGAVRVLALESDPWACGAARENVERNGVEERVEVVEAVVTPRFVAGALPLDGIVANIESGVLVSLLPGFRAGLAPGGWLILSGILESEAGGVREAAASEGFRFASEVREDGWWSGAFVSGPLPADRPSDGAPSQTRAGR